MSAFSDFVVLDKTHKLSRILNDSDTGFSIAAARDIFSDNKKDDLHISSWYSGRGYKMAKKVDSSGCYLLEDGIANIIKRRGTTAVRHKGCKLDANGNLEIINEVLQNGAIVADAIDITDMDGVYYKADGSVMGAITLPVPANSYEVYKTICGRDANAYAFLQNGGHCEIRYNAGSANPVTLELGWVYFVAYFEGYGWLVQYMGYNNKAIEVYGYSDGAIVEKTQYIEDYTEYSESERGILRVPKHPTFLIDSAYVYDGLLVCEVDVVREDITHIVKQNINGLNTPNTGDPSKDAPAIDSGHGQRGRNHS
ncbi:hypothetical protein FACS189487_10520 [Campylobacterota bacterium]|nr:hypothetical protein FACS189487_10520 [Campylobacterota bacterium]